MANPTQRDVHIDRALTDISVAYKNEEYFARQMAPIVPVNKDSDTYFVYGKTNLKKRDDKWTPGTRAQQIEWTVSSAPSYVCMEHALEDQIIWKYRDNADDPIRYEQDSVENLQDSILLQDELDGVSFFSNIGNYGDGTGTGATANVATPKVPWSSTTAFGQAGMATPLQDVFQASKLIHQAVLKKPNIMAVTDNVFDVLCVNPQIVELMKYTQGGTVPEEVLARLFRVKKFIVLSTEYDNAPEGKASTGASVWPDYCWLIYAEPTPGIKKVSHSYTMQRKGYPYTKRWVEDATDSDWLRNADSYVRKLVDPYAGFMLQGIL